MPTGGKKRDAPEKTTAPKEGKDVEPFQKKSKVEGEQEVVEKLPEELPLPPQPRRSGRGKQQQTEETEPKTGSQEQPKKGRRRQVK